MPTISRHAPLAALALTLAACGHLRPGRFVDARVPAGDTGPAPVAAPPAPATPPPAPALPAPAPEAPPAPATPRSLDDLVDLALSHDPTTRAAWHDARQAAAVAGSRRSAFYPTVDATGTAGRGTRSSGPSPTTQLGASASLSWLLLDLGARSASIEEADRLLLAARLARRAAVMDLVLSVQETWYQYLGARALVASEDSAVKQAEVSLRAAEERRRAGLATIADVLQARTAASQARLRLQQAEGDALALRGALATLAGLPPTAALEVGTLPETVARDEAEPEVERLLAEAAARSPDLARARAVAEASDARARATARADWPTLSLQSSAARTYTVRPERDADSWSIGFTLRVPLFEGLRSVYDGLAAREAARADHARADATAQRVMLDVWTSHQALRTAGLRLDTARDLLESASQSAEVATGRYKEGVGSILDLLTAQAALENARAEDVRARADWLVALARLARTTGRLEEPAPSSGEPR